MSGVTPLVDTLLATRLGQRLDLVPLKAQAEIAGPGAVASVQKVDNELRLPSREALQRQLGVGLAGRGSLAGPAAANADGARHGGAVVLSAVARTVSALLKVPVGSTPAVRGQAALLPDMRAFATAPVLAATLARTVSESGLFYESHLQQYAAGQRTLAQLAREPQAGLASPAAAMQPSDVSPPLPLAAGTAPASLATLLEGMAALPSLPPLPPPLLEGGPVLEMPEAEFAANLAAAAPTDKAGRPEPTSPATTYGRSGLPDSLPSIRHDFSVPDAETPASVSSATATSMATSADTARATPPAAPIHPDAVGLVRQQFDMLAQPVFRWSGEGWPGVAMDWEIRQEQGGEREGREGQADGGPDTVDTAPGNWVTRMTLNLPRLGTVGVRLGLDGAALRLRLEASREGTAAVLNQAGAELSRRLGAAGLALAELHIGRAAQVGPAGGGDAG